MAADIRIDRYEVLVTSNGQTQTITSVSDTSKAFVRLVGSSTKFSGGPEVTTSNSDPEDLCIGVQLTSTTQLTFYGDTISANGNRVMVEVWVYTGDADGAYEFKTRQRGSVTVSNGSSSNTASLSGVTDRNDVVPFYTGFTTSEASRSNTEMVTMACHVDSSTNITFSRNNTGSAITCYYEAVEFTGSGWSVGHGVSSSHDTGNDVDGTGGDVVTLNTDSTGTGGSSFDVSDWETAMIVEGTMEGDTAETGLSDCHLVVRPETSTTQVRFTLDNANSRNDGTAYCHVIQCDDLSVKRTFSYNLSEGNNTYGTLSVPTGTDSGTATSEAALEWFVTTSGEGTAWGRGCLIAQITAMTGSGIQHWVHRSGNVVSASYAIADFSAMEDTGGGTFTGTGAAVLAAVIASASGTFTAPSFSGTGAGTLGAFTASASGTSAGTDTLYTVVYPSSGSKPSNAQIIAGQDATGSAATFDDSQTVSTTSTPTFSATGLSASTSYKAAFVWSDGVDESNSVETSAFVTDNDGTAAGTLSALTGSASGTFENAAVSGTGTGDLAALTGDASGTHTAPVFSGTATGDMSPLTGDASGAHTAPQFSGTGVGDFVAFTADASGTFSPPVFNGTGIGDLAALTGDATGTHAAPVFSGTGVGDLAALTGDASGTHVDPGTGSAAATLEALTGSASGTHTAPVFSGTGVGDLAAITGDADGTAAGPEFTGTAVASLSALTGDVSGTHSAPEFTGTAAGDLQALTGDASGQYIDPGVSVAAGTLQAFTADAVGTVSSRRGGGAKKRRFKVSEEEFFGPKPSPIDDIPPATVGEVKRKKQLVIDLRDIHDDHEAVTNEEMALLMELLHE